MEGTGASQSFSSSSPSSSLSVPRPPPSIGLGLKSRPTTAATTGEKELKRRKLPSAKEMVAHYESKGMETQEASLKVIEDLQNLLFRAVTTKNKGREPPLDLNAVNSRLLRLESKLDSKPGYAQTLAIGVASGAVLRVVPEIAASVANIWNYVRFSTLTSSKP